MRETGGNQMPNTNRNREDRNNRGCLSWVGGGGTSGESEHSREEEERLCVITEGKRVTPENKVFSKQSKSLGKQMENQIKRSLTMEGAKHPGSRP